MAHRTTLGAPASEIISQCTNPAKAPSLPLHASRIADNPEDCEHAWTFNLLSLAARSTGHVL
jgi:hypothetical protein